MEAGNWFHSGIVRNTVEFQSGDDFRMALGRSSLSGLETPLGVLFDFLMSTVSGGMLTDLCDILYNRIIRWSRRRSANGCHFRSFRSCVTLTDPYWPRAQQVTFLCAFSMESRVLVENGVPNAGTIFQLRPGQGDESGLPALIWATTEIASNKTQPLVGLTDNSGYMLGPTQIVCEGNTQVHSIRHWL